MPATRVEAVTAEGPCPPPTWAWQGQGRKPDGTRSQRKHHRCIVDADSDPSPERTRAKAISRSRTRIRRSAALMTPLNPTPAAIADASGTDQALPSAQVLPSAQPAIGASTAIGGRSWAGRRAGRSKRRAPQPAAPARRRRRLPHLSHGPVEGPRSGDAAGQGGRSHRGQGQRPGAGRQRGGREHAAAHRLVRDPGDLAGRHEIVCEIHDEGTITDPLAGQRRPASDATGGHGLWLVYQVCDLVELRSDQTGTTIRMHMRIRPPGRPDRPAAVYLGIGENGRGSVRLR